MAVDKLFNPEKVAVVGASREEGKTGHEIFDNLLHDFDGETVPVNPNADEIHGIKAEDEIPEDTDLAVIAVPSKIVPNVMEDCAEKNVDGAVVISAGFSETGNQELEDEILGIADENDIQLLGPNVLGVINTRNGLNASFATKMPYTGNINFMSQSGAFCTAVLDYSEAENIGFNHFVSLGNKAQIDESDLLKHWREDGSEVILSYTEGIEDGRDFMREARETSLHKPIVMIKSGRTEEGEKAASSHTGSIAGSYEAYRAAFRKTGIIEAESNRELLDLGKSLSWQTLPQGENIAVITNAGGPGVVTSDEINQRGMELADFSPETKRELEEFLPEEANVHNPLDLIGDAGQERYRKALEAVEDDDRVDAILVLLTPQANTEIEKTAKTVSKASAHTEKPVMACFMGKSDVEPGRKILEERGVPAFVDPVDAVKVLESMKEYREFLETDYTLTELDYDKLEAEEALENFSGYEDAEKLLNAYGIKTALTEVTETPQETVESASNIGFPVVMKINSPDISHKTDVDGIRQGIETRDEVKKAYHSLTDEVYDERPGATIEGVQVQEQLEGLEVALGLKKDPQFGPMVMVGLGGIYIEAIHDVTFGIPPISDEEAEEMIEELRSHELFEGVRGEDHSLEPVKQAIMRLGEIGMHHEQIQALDINPLILQEEDAYVADIEIEFES
jgi:acetyltransferase